MTHSIRHIAETFGVPYGAVIGYADAMLHQENGDGWGEFGLIAVDAVYRKLTRVYDRNCFNETMRQHIGLNFRAPPYCDELRLKPKGLH